MSFTSEQNQGPANGAPSESSQDATIDCIMKDREGSEEPSPSLPASAEPTGELEQSHQPLPGTQTAPPPPPIALLPPPSPVVELKPEPPTLRILTGNLSTALRMSHRASRWLLVILDFSHKLPNRLQVTETLASSINGWRPRCDSSYGESYTSFFPSGGKVHIALLDTRSGERLDVWGEPRIPHAEEPEPVEWSVVTKMLEVFVSQHSLDGGELGPLHHREKPWFVKTRRVSESPSLPPTSMMDDEEAAIAAAIAASLADAQREMSDDSEELDEDEDVDDEVDMTTLENVEHAKASVDSIQIPSATRPGAWSDGIGGDSPSSYSVQNRFEALEPDAAQGSENEDEDEDDDVNDDDEDMEESGSGSMDVSVPLPDRENPSLRKTKPETILPSSVESLASSYMERLHSRYRSANDASLLESRLLRQEQDAELAASLEQDRRKIREKEEKAKREAKVKEAQISAQNRLPEEPEKSNTEAIAVALRLPGGRRVMRRFLKTALLSNIADLCCAHSGIDIGEREPAACLRSPAISLLGIGWNNDIKSVCSGSHGVMFIVHCE